MKHFWNFQDSTGGDAADLYIYGPIVSSASWWDDSIDAVQFSEDLKALGGKDVTVHINSPGGDVFAAHAIHNQLIAYAGNVDVIIDGIAASAATIIAMAGTRITMPTNSMMMIHNPAMGLDDHYTADDLDKYANALRAVRQSIIAAYMKRVSVDQTQIEQMMDAETWLTAQECVDMGLADAVDGRINSVLDGNNLIVNSLKIDITNYKNRKGLAHCVNAQDDEKKGAEVLSKSKLEEILNALGLRIDDTTTPQPAPAAAPTATAAPAVDAKAIAAEAVAQERQRMADLDAMADGNPAVAAIISTAKHNGQTADDVRDYVAAVQGVKSAAQAQLQDMQAESKEGGTDGITPGAVDDSKTEDDKVMDLIAQAMGGSKGGKR
ncbi:head maturation protease, ClpP-related [Megasphaera sp. SC8-1]|uniref:head maturation protease, ClpP-related n=1 Tax=Megasphaera sp. SC8-1 TaxID=2965102 RepID=UPI00210DB79E|nr:head maturation protease, ClpP-related [Megasphaera sp. SC8-1]MCQ4113717.1 Clp protease ClpP [Megasphaera sp. SC8-1]